MKSMSLNTCSWPMLALVLAFGAVSAAGQGLSSWTDTFENLDNWIPYGSPPPLWVPAFAGRNGLFDNNGDPNYGSGAISKQRFDLSGGYVIESQVYLDFSDLGGCWAEPSIGIADPQYQDWGGYGARMFLDLAANGDACWANRAETLRHAILFGGYETEEGFEHFGFVWDPADGVIFADHLANRWVTLTIMVSPDGFPVFLADGALVYEGTKPVSARLRSDTGQLWLGSRSSGSAGKAYHDAIWFSNMSASGAPSIVSQPAGQSLYVGEAVRLNVVATGKWPLNYQWRKDGLELMGATNSTLVISNATVSASGDYTVVVSNDFGSVPSDVARVEVRAVTAADLVRGLVAYYPFSGNADDASGNGRHGTLVGNPAPTEDRWGRPASAYFFGDPTNYVIALGSESLHLESGLTLSVWFRTSYSGPGYNTLAGKHVPGYHNGYFAIVYPEDELGFFVGGEHVWATGISDGTWHHAIGTCEGSVARLYVDGVLRGVRVDNRAPRNDVPFAIGNLADGWHQFHGVLDEVRLYDRALSDAEVMALYEYDERTTNVPLASYVRSELVQKATWAPATSGSVHRVVTSGTRAFVLSGDSEVQALDLSKPASPVLLGTWRPLFQPYDIEAAGNLLYIATWEPDFLSTVEIVDFSDPAKPVLRGYYDTDGYALDVAIAGNAAYVADADAGLLILDVSDPAFPRRLSGFDTLGSVRLVSVAGRYAYAVDGSWLLILDVSDPWNPRRVGVYEAAGEINAIKATGGRLYLVDGGGDLRILDVTEPTNVTVLGTYPGWGGGGGGMAAFGKYAYLPLGPRGLQVVDVSDPAKPSWLTGAWATPAEDVALASGHVLVAAGEQGLLVYELKQSIHPALKAPALTNGLLTLTWPYLERARLQKSTNLTAAKWEDVAESEGTNMVNLSAADGTAFFRLVKGPKPIPSPPGMVAWWSGDGNALDLVGTNHGTLNGISFSAGMVRKAFSFDNPGERVWIPASVQLDVGTGDGLTIEAWIQPSDVLPAGALVSWDRVGSRFGAHFYFGDTGWTGPGGLFANLVDTTGNYHFVTSPKDLVMANVWSHVALTYSKFTGAAKFYHDGIQVADQQVGSFTPETSSAFNIGYAPHDGATYDGTIDEVSLYNRALTANEVKAIYDAGSAGKTKPSR